MNLNDYFENGVVKMTRKEESYIGIYDDNNGIDLTQNWVALNKNIIEWMKLSNRENTIAPLEFEFLVDGDDEWAIAMDPFIWQEDDG